MLKQFAEECFFPVFTNGKISYVESRVETLAEIFLQ